MASAKAGVPRQQHREALRTLTTACKELCYLLCPLAVGLPISAWVLHTTFAVATPTPLRARVSCTLACTTAQKAAQVQLHMAPSEIRTFDEWLLKRFISGSADDDVAHVLACADTSTSDHFCQNWCAADRQMRIEKAGRMWPAQWPAPLCRRAFPDGESGDLFDTGWLEKSPTRLGAQDALELQTRAKSRTQQRHELTGRLVRRVGTRLHRECATALPADAGPPLMQP